MDAASTSDKSSLGAVRTGDRFVVGDSVVTVSETLAAEFREGDKLLAVQSRGELLHVRADDAAIAKEAVTGALVAFRELGLVADGQIDNFFGLFAAKIADDAVFAPVLEANRLDVDDAKKRGRTTGRLELTPKMRADMVAGLTMWAGLDLARDQRVGVIEHDGWNVETWRAPLGVVAFVFEGRPNVFADATGVLKSGNTVVFRIGSDALGTARALRDHVLLPALSEAGLPAGCVQLVDSPRHAAGWALFSDSRLALAVARGSGPTVDQLGAIARQSGVPVSLHGTGGAWFLVSADREEGRLASTIATSLDRKVCNTLNVIVLERANARNDILEMVAGLEQAVATGPGRVIVHLSRDDADAVGMLPDSTMIEWRVERTVDLAREWEWDTIPEISVAMVDEFHQGIVLFNAHSPQFVLSVISSRQVDHDAAWAEANAPFVGDGFSRWVDGQYALDRPELGLANWQHGRMLARGGVLSGDGVHTLRLRVHQRDITLKR
jgi:glutamate-5-semialdehyde dehydrogenase